MSAFCLLTHTNSHTSEGASPGEGRGGGIGGGAPLRYDYTAPGYCALSSWNDATYTYSILQLNLGSNPISKLEVASMLNILSQARYTYHYNSYNCPERYYPKVYIGTSQTIAYAWNHDSQNGTETTLPNWPQSYQQGPQKGEANTKNL